MDGMNHHRLYNGAKSLIIIDGMNHHMHHSKVDLVAFLTLSWWIGQSYERARDMDGTNHHRLYNRAENLIIIDCTNHHNHHSKADLVALAW
jgi:hypothetical protein